MKLRQFYDIQSASSPRGGYIDGRIMKTEALFARHLPGPPRRLLDVGCGVGAITAYLGDRLRVGEVCGVDIAGERVEAARRAGVEAYPCELNEEALPFPDGHFDAVFCGEVIEHLVDPDHMLDEIGRVLAPGGVCVLTTPNLASWPNRLGLLLGWQPFYTSVSLRHDAGRPRLLTSDFECLDHLRVFTWGALREVLRLHGFRVLKVSGASLLDGLPPSRSPFGDSFRQFLLRAASPLDWALSRVPSLAIRVIVAFTPATEAAGGQAEGKR